MSTLAPLLLAAAFPLQAPPPVPDPSVCELPTIEQVEIVRHDVFERTGNESWLYRTANNLHVRTREQVIRRELLFGAGERLDLEALGQSERNLRETRFLSVVQIVVLGVDGELLADPSTLGLPEVCAALHGHTEVRVRVTTRDSWSTSIDGALRKTADRWIFGIGVEESNLLGHGKSLALAHRDDIDRTSNLVAYTDPRLAGSRLALRAEYADQSDGARGVAEIGQPFFSLDTKWAYSLRIESFDQTDPLYLLGEEISRLHHVRRWQEASAARLLRRRGRNSLRFHVAYRRLYDDVEVETRRFGVLQVGLSSTEHRFREITHLNHERAEDLNLGAQSQLWVGLSTPALGGDGTALFFTATHRRGFALGNRRLLLGALTWTGRVEQGQIHNGIADARLTYVDLSVPRHVMLVSAHLRYGTRLDPETQVTLGAQNGLRGYAVHQWVGARSLLLSAEYRWFLLDDVLRVASLGVAAFVDSGYAWPQGQSMHLGDLTTNVGISLLIGRKQLSTRHAGMRVDLAYALDPVFGRSRWVLSFGTATRIDT